MIGLSPFAGASILFTEDFEAPPVSGYQQGITPEFWVRGAEGFNSDRHGLINKNSGEFESRADSQQGYIFDFYKNVGMTTKPNALGPPLAAGGGYRFSFDVARRLEAGGTSNRSFQLQVIAYAPGASRRDARSTGSQNNLLDTFSGSAPEDGSIQRVSFDYFPDLATQSEAIGKDLAVRFIGSSKSAVIDNLVVEAIAGRGQAFTLVTTDVQDDSTEALPNRPLRAFFSKDIKLGSGNLTVRDLTAGTQLTLSPSDRRLTVSGPTLEIDGSDFLNHKHDYAILLSSNFIKSTSGDSFSGISSPSTWNFTVADGDPLLGSFAQLKGHILGEITLSEEDIDRLKKTLDLVKYRYAESAESITAAFDLVTTYETEIGPLWINHKGFTRNKNIPANDIHWTIFNVMQTIMDRIYQTNVINRHEDLIDGYLFKTSSRFPGAVDPPANANVVHRTMIDGSFLKDRFGTGSLGWSTHPARKPTGTYLAPGSVATVQVPTSIVNKGYLIRVGAHNVDHEFKPRQVLRLDRPTKVYFITSPTMKVANPLGGSIYIEVPFGADAGNVQVSIRNAIRSPFFSAQTFKKTTIQEWRETERNHPAPWADIQTERFMATIPTSWINLLDDPRPALAEWDAAMDLMDTLMGIEPGRGKETMYFAVDLLRRSNVNAPGYPVINVTYNPESRYNGNQNHYLVRGPRRIPYFEFHEQGHAYRFPKFEGEKESTVNLLHVGILNQLYGTPIDDVFPGSMGKRKENSVDQTAITWMTSFNFSPRKVAMKDDEKNYQLKGHAKFVDIARLFGWQAISEFYRFMNVDQEEGTDLYGSHDGKILLLCKTTGVDVRPLLYFWGIFPADPEGLAADIQGAGYQPSAKIYDQLMRYKGLVPEDLPAFQEFALRWWGKVPGYGSGSYRTEKQHARQFGGPNVGIAPEGTNIERPGGDIYNEASALDIRNRVQEIIDIYFPGGQPAETPYSKWVSQYPDVKGKTARTQDADGDGMANILENLLGTDPSKYDEPLAVAYEPANRGVDLEHGFNPDKSPDVELNYQWSTNLKDWYDADGNDSPGGGLTVSRIVREGNRSRAVSLVPSRKIGDLYLRMSAESTQN